MNKIKYFTLAFIFVAQQAYAQTAGYLLLNSRFGTDSGIKSIISGRLIEVTVVKDHSTYCRYRTANHLDELNFSTNINCAIGSCSFITARTLGLVDGGIDYSPDDNDAISFTATGTGNQNFVVAVTPSPLNVIVECLDTTLFGNYNTVTAANPFNFLELTNDTNSSANILLVVYSNSGTEIARKSFSLNARQQLDTSIHDIPGASNTYGSILVSHNTVPGGIRANVTKYTSSFLITASTPLSTRPNTM